MVDDQPKKRKRQITAKEKKEVLKIYDNKCNRCSKSFEVGDYIEFDHIIPFAIGGESVIENMQPLCYDCKSIKNPRDASEIARIKRYRKNKEKEPIKKMGSGRKLNSGRKMSSGNKLSGGRKMNSSKKFKKW